MMNQLFTIAPWALMLVLGAMLLAAGLSDFRTRIISNRLNLAIALTAPLYWGSVGLPLWPGAAIQFGLALAVFAVFLLFFRLGAMGGGDVKLAAALALWFSPAEMLMLLVVMSIAGAPVTLAALADHRRSGQPGHTKVPYGIAIAVGAAVILAQRILNHSA
jgi:prepilin peptidase CpaA